MADPRKQEIQEKKYSLLRAQDQRQYTRIKENPKLTPEEKKQKKQELNDPAYKHNVPIEAGGPRPGYMPIKEVSLNLGNGPTHKILDATRRTGA